MINFFDLLRRRKIDEPQVQQLVLLGAEVACTGFN